MTLHMTRESVCMGDDVLAPNAGTLDVPAGTLLAALLGQIVGSGYLASVAGGATWSVWAHGNLLATLHVPDSARPGRPAETLLAAGLAAGSEALSARDLEPLSFRYHCSAHPAEVLRNPQVRR